jgi:hypothetical protein
VANLVKPQTKRKSGQGGDDDEAALGALKELLDLASVSLFTNTKR